MVQWRLAGLLAGVSLDGGAKWRTVPIPGTTACTGGSYKRASDPWVTIAPNGTAYYMTLAFDPDLPSGSFGRNAMLVNRSTDGGSSWSGPITLIQDPDGQALNDKNSSISGSSREASTRRICRSTVEAWQPLARASARSGKPPETCAR